MDFKKIGFIGLGLIGGSLAKTIKRIYPETELIATSGHLSTITAAFEDHTISNDTLLAMKDFSDCDIIFLCAPVSNNIEYLKELKGIISESCLLTDVGSVKEPIQSAIKELGMESNFIGGHPMAGSEKTGLSNASETLLENAYYIITPTTKSPSPAVEELTGLVRSLGAIPLVLGYEQHDYATAAISHLPHVIAYSLVNLVRESDDENEIMKTIAAGGFKDITRIASSSPVMWENICLSNQEQILKLLDNYIHTLEVVRTNIADADSPALLDAFTAAKDYRDSITITAKGALKNVYELYLDLIDETGGIATVATILASNNLSIKNIGIIHNREFEGGVLRLEMYDGESLALAVALLKKHHYTIYER